jgi:GNAT superfamily N-acetyltransferase
MRINNATNSDKEKILDFCKNTFSWGDYISEVWNYWIKEGKLLVMHQDDNPVGICHASINSDSKQVWIEGIRVHPDFRRQGIAQKLVLESEIIAKNTGCKYSFMLIDVNNLNSLQLANHLGYEKKDVWTFYQLDAQKIPTEIKFLKTADDLTTLYSKNYSYVDSWRWYPLDKNSILSLIKKNRIIISENKGVISGLAVFTNSQHFDGTLLVTILDGNSNELRKILEFIQNFAFEKNFTRIQILTKFSSLPEIGNLKKRLLFSLMKKDLIP